MASTIEWNLLNSTSWQFNQVCVHVCVWIWLSLHLIQNSSASCECMQKADSCLGKVICGVTKRIQDPMYLCDLAFTDPWNKKALFLWFMLFSLDTLGGILCYIEISNQFISRVVLDQCQFWIWQCCSVFTTQGGEVGWATHRHPMGTNQGCCWTFNDALLRKLMIGPCTIPHAL